MSEIHIYRTADPIGAALPKPLIEVDQRQRRKLKRFVCGLCESDLCTLNEGFCGAYGGVDPCSAEARRKKISGALLDGRTKEGRAARQGAAA